MSSRDGFPPAGQASKKKGESQSEPHSRKKCKSKKKSSVSKAKGPGPCQPQPPNTKGQGKNAQATRLRSTGSLHTNNVKNNKGGNKMAKKKAVSEPRSQKDKVQDTDNKEIAAERSRKRRNSERREKRQEKIRQANRRMSNLVFVMPKAGDDPQTRIQHAAEKKINKLIRYLKKYWVTHIDKKFYPVRIDFRMVDRMTHQRPDNWWLIKRARQKMYEHTGFFSNVREPYHDLGPPELDSAMLIFQNLHEDLITDPTRWIEDRKQKDELIRKCNAPLERLPRARARRPQYSKGRIKLGAGGMLSIDKYVKTGFSFQNNIMGGITYTQTLDQWMDRKENEVEGLASAFGYVPRKAPVESTEASSSASSVSKRSGSGRGDKSNSNSTGTEIKALAGDGKKNSTVDDRVQHRNIILFEQMMNAMLHIVRSLLNIRASHLRSHYPLPLRVVTHIRSTSPRAKKNKLIKAASTVSLISEMPSCGEPTNPELSRVSSKLLTQILPRSLNSKLALDVDQNIVNKDKKESTAQGDPTESNINLLFSTRSIFTTLGSIPGPGDQGQRADGITASGSISQNKPAPRLNTADLVESIKKAYAIKEARVPISPEELVKSIRETPEEAVVRTKTNNEMFSRLFSKTGELSKGGIWTNINTDNAFSNTSTEHCALFAVTQCQNTVFFPWTDTPEQKSVENGSTTGSLTKIAKGGGGGGGQDMGMRSEKRMSLPSTSRIPHLADIPTPTLPGLQSPPRLDSEEQSLQNVLSKNPEAARKEPPSSPIRRLFETAGIETTEKVTFNTLMGLKKKFRTAEKTLKFYYANETDKADWETMMRFTHKISALEPCPVYERSINRMRNAMRYRTLAEQKAVDEDAREKRPALWYRKLKEKFDEMGANRHQGCASVLLKLFQYCDVDMKTKPKMLNRFCLLVVSLPTTELGTRHWQHAVKFILENLLGMPVELFYQWLEQRRLPSIV